MLLITDTHLDPLPLYTHLSPPKAIDYFSRYFLSKYLFIHLHAVESQRSGYQSSTSHHSPATRQHTVPYTRVPREECIPKVVKAHALPYFAFLLEGDSSALPAAFLFVLVGVMDSSFPAGRPCRSLKLLRIAFVKCWLVRVSRWHVLQGEMRPSV